MDDASRVRSLSYPDFVAFIGQANTPPGADATVRGWEEMARIDAGSHVLDLACSTGYSSRCLARRTGCSGLGIDLSRPALAVAESEARRAGLEARLRYIEANAAALPLPDAAFSHVVAGACFGFIHERERALDEVFRVLAAGGALCVASFHYRQEPPAELLDEVARAIGYRPDPARVLGYWQAFFSRRFTLVDERRGSLEPYPEDAVERDVRALVFEESEPLAVQPPSVRDACFDRLLWTRRVLNEHRRYQGLSVTVWRRP